jgi:hypothetical protein
MPIMSNAIVTSAFLALKCGFEKESLTKQRWFSVVWQGLRSASSRGKIAQLAAEE